MFSSALKQNNAKNINKNFKKKSNYFSRKVYMLTMKFPAFLNG